jgi:aminoglycoside N3'-acetyltransferase
MRDVTREQVLAALEAVGLYPGEGVLVHSAIQFLGRPRGGVGMYLEVLGSALDIRDAILENRDSRFVGNDSRISNLESRMSYGTLAFPTFNFAFARGEPYDPRTTPSREMGALSEYVRQQPGALRTPHPMQSLAVLGRYAADVAGRDTHSAFDPGSPFERLLELDFKLLLIGAGVQAVSMVHYSEQRACVPYRYWKEFTGPVKTPAGWETRTYRMFVRNLEMNPQLDLHPIQGLLEERGQWRSATINYGRVASCRLVDFVAAADDLLAKDPWAFVSKSLKIEG